MKRVFVSIINFNGKENTFSCLESLEKVNTQGLDLTVLVIDNGSKEEFKIRKEKFKNKTEVIYNNENLGFSGGHNVGFKYALSHAADYVVVLNNDVILDKDFLAELLKYLEENKDVGIASSKIYFAAGYEYHKGKYTDEEQGKVFWYGGGIMDWANVIGKNRGVDEVDVGQYGKAGRTDMATGCCMMIRRETLEKIGFFDDKYFLYYEDNDFCQRAKKKGFEVSYVPDSIIWHKNASSAGGPGSPLQDYYITRNRMLFGMRYAPLRSKLALVRESMKLLLSGRKWQKKGITDFYLRKFGRGSYRNE